MFKLWKKIEDDASFCANCGKSLKGDNNQNYQVVTSPGTGTATASMVLGIIAVIIAIITLFIALGFAAYVDYDWYGVGLHNDYHSELIITAVLVISYLLFYLLLAFV